MPIKQSYALKSLCDEAVNVVSNNIEVYICGTNETLLNSQGRHKKELTSNTTTKKAIVTQGFAHVAGNNNGSSP